MNFTFLDRLTIKANAFTALAIMVFSFARAEFREWTSSDGKVVTAAFVSYDIETGVVTFLRNIQGRKSYLLQDNDFFNTNINRLSKSDKDLIRKLWEKDLIPADQEINTGYYYYKKGMSALDGENKYLMTHFMNLAVENKYYYANYWLSFVLKYSSSMVDQKFLFERLVEGANNGNPESMEELGIVYMNGIGTKPDYFKSRSWLEKAASGENGSVTALNHLADLSKKQGRVALAADYEYRYGKRMLENSMGWPDNIIRNNVLLTIDDLNKLGARDLAAKLRSELYENDKNSDPDAEVEVTAYGTGWFCSPRHVVTCWHVLAGNEKYSFISESFKKTPLKLIVKDEQNDLAILEIVSEQIFSEVSLPIAPGGTVTAQDVFTTGFPHVGLLGKAPKYTDGTISSTSGIGDDPRILQISVPVQSGNSGGALLDSRGMVVGVVASKLSAAKVFEWTGDLPQNINYAVKSDYLKILLKSKEIPYSTKPLWEDEEDRPVMLNKINKATVQIIAE